VLRGEKKQREYSKKKNSLRRMKDVAREKEQEELEGGGTSCVGLAFRGNPVRISGEDLRGFWDR